MDCYYSAKKDNVLVGFAFPYNILKEFPWLRGGINPY